MKTLALVNGDLVVTGSGHATVSGAGKTVQDIGVALREEFGIDRFHPMWGSLLPDMVGRPLTDEVQQDVRSEVVRIINNYMAVQQEVIANKAYGSTVSTSEVLDRVTKVTVTPQDFGTMRITVNLLTLDNRRLVLSTTVGV